MSPLTAAAARTSRSSAVRHGSALTFETLADADRDTRMRPREDTLLRVIAGVLRLAVGTEQRLLGPGDEALIPAGAPHELASAGGGVRFITGFRPAMS
jgi:mannose-6-phosphate isomerase-like protein (cupin superfamily)